MTILLNFNLKKCFFRSATIIIWVPAFIVDRVANSKSNECIYDPALNKEFVVVVAALGYHGSTAAMLFCYIKVCSFSFSLFPSGCFQI